ncbi:hypothetical protein M8J77_012355 [Diaphorina citri]|nr:hypothetical protein M8J77_012355 [Diaphorina citri]
MCTSLSSVSLLCGFLSLGTLLTAFVSNVWIYTKEPVKLPSSDIQTTVLFRIGLWRVCPTYKRINSTIVTTRIRLAFIISHSIQYCLFEIPF